MIHKELTLSMFRSYIPRRLRFWTLLLFAFFFQLSDGFYLASAAHIAGTTSMKQSDVMMCAYISFIGLTMLFPVLFPIKMRFGEKVNIIIAASGLVICNLLVIHISFIPLLGLICFLAGIFRIWGTFSCMSTIMQGITSNFNPGHFLSVMFLLVLGTIQLSGLATSYITYLTSWQLMHYLAISLELVMIITAILFMHKLPVKKEALRGTDWAGMVLWSIFLIGIVFVAVYGNQLEWWSSPYIRVVTGVVCISFGLNIARMRLLENPFISIKAFKCRNIVNILALFFILCFMLSSQSILQNIFTSRILHFDVLNTSSLNWFVLLGVVTGAFFSFVTLVHLGWKHKNVMSVGILFVTLYAASMYFLISPTTSLAALYMPSFFRGLGTCLVYVALTSYCEGAGEFRYFFQVLCLLGFIRTGIASPIGNAFYEHHFTGLMNENIALLGSNLNHAAYTPMSYEQIVNEVSRQSMMVSLQSLYGITILIGVVTLLVTLTARYKRHITARKVVRASKAVLQLSKNG